MISVFKNYDETTAVALTAKFRPWTIIRNQVYVIYNINVYLFRPLSSWMLRPSYFGVSV